MAIVCSNPVESNKQVNLDNEETRTGVLENFMFFEPIPNFPFALLPKVYIKPLTSFLFFIIFF